MQPMPVQQPWVEDEFKIALKDNFGGWITGKYKW
jgi:hypothetical protein